MDGRFSTCRRVEPGSAAGRRSQVGKDSGRMIPRIPMDSMPPVMAQMLRPKVERLGYLGEFFQCAANQPDALISFMQFTDDLKAALPDNLTEIVALTVSAFMSNTYERHQQER